MISVKGDKVEIRGFGAEILAEATILLEAIHHSLEKQGGETFALACMASILETYKNRIDGFEEDCTEYEDEEDVDPMWWD